MPKTSFFFSDLFCYVACLPCSRAGPQGHPTVPGAEPAVYWAIPFACMLLSIALMPLLAPHLWEHHFGKISLFWGLAFLIPCALVYGASTALYEFLHIILSGLHPLYYSAFHPLYRGWRRAA